MGSLGGTLVWTSLPKSIEQSCISSFSPLWGARRSSSSCSNSLSTSVAAALGCPHESFGRQSLSSKTGVTFPITAPSPAVEATSFFLLPLRTDCCIRPEARAVFWSIASGPMIPLSSICFHPWRPRRSSILLTCASRWMVTKQLRSILKERFNIPAGRSQILEFWHQETFFVYKESTAWVHTLEHMSKT